jgi:hypothetical protein
MIECLNESDDIYTVIICYSVDTLLKIAIFTNFARFIDVPKA